MTLPALLRAIRFDGLWWRKFAYLGSAYGPEWWKRCSPPFIAAVIFACVAANRRGAVANMRRVLGRHGWLQDHWHGLRVFIAFAHCLNETLEFFSPRRQPLDMGHPPRESLANALAKGRGAVFVTCHFGNWDIAAQSLASLGTPVNVVMAEEANETAATYAQRAREEGVHIIPANGSVFQPFSMLRALRRNEIVALQLDRPMGGPGARTVDFFGAPAPFQIGPLRLARSARAPIFAAFVVRMAPRRYRIVLGQERQVPRHAMPEEMDELLASIVGEFEDLVRHHPDQWFQFAPFWPEDGGAPTTPRSSAGGDPAPTAYASA